MNKDLITKNTKSSKFAKPQLFGEIRQVKCLLLHINNICLGTTISIWNTFIDIFQNNYLI